MLIQWVPSDLGCNYVHTGGCLIVVWRQSEQNQPFSRPNGPIQKNSGFLRPDGQSEQKLCNKLMPAAIEAKILNIAVRAQYTSIGSGLATCLHAAHTYRRLSFKLKSKGRQWICSCGRSYTTYFELRMYNIFMISLVTLVAGIMYRCHTQGARAFVTATVESLLMDHCRY